MITPKWLCVMLIAVVTAGGALAPRPTMAQMAPMQQEASQGSREPPSTGAKIGAAALNVVYVPGKAIICGFGSLVAGVMMLATLGSAFREATSFYKEGCTGPWTVTPEQVASVPKTVQFEY
jgi:hypothetical protein